MRGFALRLIRDPATLREQVEQQVRAEKESKPWLRDAREAATARERLAKLDTKADALRDQQGRGPAVHVRSPREARWPCRGARGT